MNTWYSCSPGKTYLLFGSFILFAVSFYSMLYFFFLPSIFWLVNTFIKECVSHESMAYRFFIPMECKAGGDRKFTTVITDLWQSSVHNDIAFWFSDIDSSYHTKAEFSKGQDWFETQQYETLSVKKYFISPLSLLHALFMYDISVFKICLQNTLCYWHS